MIAVVDFGGQYAQLISRRIRELGVYSKIVRHNITRKELNALISEGLKGIVLSGGPSSVYEKESPRCSNSIFEAKVPVLGICYGHQLIAKRLGGIVRKSQKKEYGKKILKAAKSSVLLSGLKGNEIVWMSHGDFVAKAPKGFRVVGKTGFCPVAAFESNKQKLYGVQFHPEVSHTKNGTKVLKNFLFRICKEKKAWKIEGLADKIVAGLREQLKEDNVMMAVSGGVDSTVAAILLHKAVGERLFCFFIDTGLLRLNEREEVENIFKNRFKLKNFKAINAANLFLSKLKGIKDPEKKRKAIGHCFISVFEREAKRIEKKHKIAWLGQGTIYPDRIESAQPSKTASKIKTHHNLALPKDMRLKIVEPLKDLYKDEVRKLGLELGVPKELLYRHPFPGPGLAIRILGELTRKKIRIEQHADYIVMDELKKAGLYNKVWQCFPVLLDSKSVGVMGDKRTYSYICAIRCVNSIDAMTADWTRLPYEFLDKLARRIVNEVDGINRVVYDITSKPPATICFE